MSRHVIISLGDKHSLVSIITSLPAVWLIIVQAGYGWMTAMKTAMVSIIVTDDFRRLITRVPTCHRSHSSSLRHLKSESVKRKEVTDDCFPPSYNNTHTRRYNLLLVNRKYASWSTEMNGQEIYSWLPQVYSWLPQVDAHDKHRLQLMRCL